MNSTTSGAQWSWPTGMGEASNAPYMRGGASSPSSSSSDAQQQSGTAGTPDESPPTQKPAQPRRRHYKPRTCRICLEEVQPTTDIDDSATAGLFTSRTRVRYVSEDQELGRLISPCKCKGSQRYVHEGCLQLWRQAAPMSERNFWRCPTCQFEYRMQRLRWGHWLTSKLTRAVLTLLILLVTIFFLGFIADPIISLWVDPLGSIANGLSEVVADIEAIRPVEDEDQVTWSFHFLKGLLSLGLLGLVKTFLVSSPWHWLNVRVGGRRRGGTGRDRIESVNWALVVIGVITFLGVSTHALFYIMGVD